ncbi:tape measure protein [Pseudomonas oryzihabitans]|uniref:tape measure protein n=1 Tax=Pseudomonas oryzihabitans TaxID=47885 RepID=UPI001D9C8BD1|nr:tape measure protein [Pseudomonas oryzihabitans]HJE67590.1 tape measure protein [Pseudomonas oryzihabitans]
MTDVELRLQADVSGAQTNLSGFRKEYQALVREVQKPLQRIDAFRDMETSLEGTQKAASSARDRIRDLGNQIATAVAPSKALQQSYRDSVSELQRLERAEAKQIVTLAAMRAEMQAAGVDTTKLAAEQARLRAQLSTRLGVAERGSALQSAAQSLGVNRYRELGSEIGNLRSQYDLLKRSGTLSAGELAIAQQTLTRRIKETKAEMDSLQGATSRFKVTDIGTGTLVAGAAGIAAVAQIAKMTDAYQLMNARLRLATGSQEAFNTAQESLREISTRAAVPLASMVNLFTRINTPMKEAGATQKQTLQIVEAVALSFRVSGASAEEASNSATQFAQALGSGALRGDEFNSVADQAPRLMQALAKGLGVTTGALKNMADNGMLTASVVTKALSGQLETLREEAAKMPETVGGAMTQLGDALNAAVGSSDLSPLISQIKELTEVVKDPEVKAGLVALASALVQLASWGVKGAAGFAKFGESIAYNSAKITGNLAKMDSVDKQIEQLKQAIQSPGPTSDPLGFFGALISGNDAALVRSKEQNEELLKQYQAYRQKLLTEMTGLTEDARTAAAERAALEKKQQEDLLEANAEALVSRRTQQKAGLNLLLADAKQYFSAQEKLEQEQLSKIEAIGEKRKEINKKYSTTVSQLRNGTAEPSYGAAQDLKVSAQNALRSGDFKTAMEQAEAARQMLLDMQKAGQSTYGLEGFAKQLQAIELGANDLEKSQADAKLDSIRNKLVELQQEASRLQNIQVTPLMSDEAANKLLDDMRALAKKIGSEATVELTFNLLPPTDNMKSMGLMGTPLDLTGSLKGLGVTVQPTLDQQAAAQAQADMQALIERITAASKIVITPVVAPVSAGDAAADVPGFATGGQISGPGTGTSDSILARLSNGEFVMRAAAVRHYGPDLLEQLNARRLPRFATGGAVGRVPAIPPVAAALLQGGEQAFLGTMDLALPGGDSLTVSVPASQRSELEIARKKFGRPRTRG